MLLEGVVLVRGQLAGLAQDHVRDADLAHVVQQPGQVDGATRLFVHTHALRQEHGIPRHVLRVALGISILGVDRDDQALQDVEGSGHDPMLLTQFATLQRVTTGSLRLAQRHGHHRQQLGQ